MPASHLTGKAPLEMASRIQQMIPTGGARPRTAPLHTPAKASAPAVSIPNRKEEGPSSLIQAHGLAIMNTGGVEMAPEGRAWDATWERLLPSRYFPFLTLTGFGVMLHPINATSTKTHGINADGASRLSEAVIGNGLESSWNAFRPQIRRVGGIVK